MCPPQALLNSTSLIAAQQCYLSNDTVCFALCPNTDLAGVGVRAAFYAQSVLNTLLVIFSPRDSVPSAWASTLLTASLIVAAIVQKVQGNITLHHATLVLNFATLSCISSLAVAPMLPIWRLSASEYYARELQLARRTVTGTTTPIADREGNVLAEEMYVNTHKKKIKKAQNKERVVLALALLIQVVLQWAWGIILFVSPSYNQAACNKTTRLRFFMYTFTALEINHGSFVVWPIWLLFCLCITLVLTIILAVSSPDRAFELSRRSSPPSPDDSEDGPVIQQIYVVAISILPPRNDVKRQLLFCGNILAFALWVLFILTSELQREDNCMITGENNFGGFGQITAVLLSLAPLWSLTVALYKYPSLLRRREQRRRRSAETQSLLHADPGSAPSSPPAPWHAPLPDDASAPMLRAVPHSVRAAPSLSTLRTAWTGGVEAVSIPSGTLEWIELTYSPRAPP